VEPDPELAVAYGIFSVSQARAAGYSRADIERLIYRGHWVRCGQGVLAAAAREPLATDDVVLALLRAGPKAVLGFASAAQIHGWDASPPAHPQLIPGAFRFLAEDDTELRGIVRLTTPGRTALDLAATLPFDQAVVMLDSGLRSDRLTYGELARTFAASHRRGVRAARNALAFADPKCGSVAETEARLLFARDGLPPPVSQHVVGRFRLDFAWEFAFLGAEIDGFQYHSANGDFQRDRTRQNAVQLDGWLVLRFTVWDIRHDPQKVVAEVRRGLARPLPFHRGPLQKRHKMRDHGP
jgi:hypothetical protein